MSFRIIIPARFASSRLPGKPLKDIGGQPMVVRVWQVACGAGALSVHIATDDERVAAAARTAGAEVVMTASNHESGTDRLAEVAAKLGWADDDIVVNLQGDEPLIDSQLLRQVGQHLAQTPEVVIATAASPIISSDDFFNPNIVKLVCDDHGYALYFSRAPIPWPRAALPSWPAAAVAGAIPETLAWRHIGLYAYRVSFLHAFSRMAPAALEQCEALEQLRALAAGYQISVLRLTEAPPHGVDTEEDLQKVRKLFDRHRA